MNVRLKRATCSISVQTKSMRRKKTKKRKNWRLEMESHWIWMYFSVYLHSANSPIFWRWSLRNSYSSICFDVQYRGQMILDQYLEPHWAQNFFQLCDATTWQKLSHFESDLASAPGRNFHSNWTSLLELKLHINTLWKLQLCSLQGWKKKRRVQRDRPPLPETGRISCHLLSSNLKIGGTSGGHV